MDACSPNETTPESAPETAEPQDPSTAAEPGARAIPVRSVEVEPAETEAIGEDEAVEGGPEGG
ncbi:MAG: hypothetical protein M3281_09435 [Chloroflexota bacterium]|nr:hypothetical protein [Chloroflexota bacterium]